jgi:hypothetical protein
MNNFIVKAIVLLALPTAIITGGDYLMGKLSGRQQLTQRLSRAKPEDKRGLGLRILGYDLEAVSRRWGMLDPSTRAVERRGLEIDLIFPFLYGGTLAAALLLVWAALGRPFPPVWLVSPVAITMLADWTENLVQLGQLSRFDASGQAGLQPGWIQIASAATMTKLVFYGGSSLLLVVLVGCMLVRGVTHRS